MQLVEIELDPGEGVRAEAGAMTYMDAGVQMQTGTGGGMFKGFKRMLTGESFFITTFMNSTRSKQRVAFGAPYPGKIIPIDLTLHGGRFMCQKDSFICAARVLRSRSPLPRGLGPACSAERVLSCSASKEMAWLSYTQEAH